MNTRTGEIIPLEITDLLNNKIIAEEFKNGDLIPVDMNQATDKQKQDMQVNIHDNRSELGKIFTGNRKSRRAQEKKYRKYLKRK